MKDIIKQLQKPFEPSDIEWRVGSINKDKTKGLALAYVTNRAIQNRLDEIFGPFGWKNEFKEWRGNSQLCGISVLHEGQWITKWDGADNTDFEATKGGLSDSMKRAAYQWGIGRYLYRLDATWVPIKAAGRSFTIAEPPKLPDWALPMDRKAWASFWVDVQKWGYTKDDVHKVAGTDSISYFTKAEATKLYKDLKDMTQPKKGAN